MKIRKFLARFGRPARLSFTIKEVALTLGVSNKTVYSWLYEEKIKGFRPAKYAGQWRIVESEVARFEK